MEDKAMKMMHTLIATLMGIVFLSCGNTKEQQEEPGPVTQMDQTRYNLNSSDKMLYGSADTLKQDSIREDSIRRSDSLPKQ